VAQATPPVDVNDNAGLRPADRRGRLSHDTTVAPVDERDEQLAILALGLTMMLLGAQAVLGVMTLFAPLAGALYELSEEEPTGPPAAVERQTEAEQQRRPVPIGPALAVIGAAASAGIGFWAAVRLYRGTIVRDRWTWVLVLSGVGCAWGIVVVTFLSRVSPLVEMFP